MAEGDSEEECFSLGDVFADSEPEKDPLNDQLLVAAERGDLGRVLSILADSVSRISCTDALFSDSPLHKATKSGNVDIVQALLRFPSVSVNQKNHNGLTPLYYACLENRVHAAKALLANGLVEVNLEAGAAYFCETALHCASRLGHVELVSAMLSHPAVDVNAVDAEGWTPLFDAVLAGHLGIVQQFVRLPATALNWVSPGGRNGILHIASAADDDQGAILSFLLDEYPKLRVQLTQHNNYLFKTATRVRWPGGRCSYFRHDTYRHALLSQSSAVGTPLHVACHQGRVAQVKILLQQPEVQINELNSNWISPLGCCLDGTTVELLLRHPSVDLQNKNQGPILHKLIQLQRQPSAVQALVADPRINVAERDNFGATALHILGKTVFEDAEMCARILVRAFPIDEINAMDARSYTALHYACEWGNMDVVMVLLRSPLIFASLIHDTNRDFARLSSPWRGTLAVKRSHQDVCHAIFTHGFCQPFPFGADDWTVQCKALTPTAIAQLLLHSSRERVRAFLLCVYRVRTPCTVYELMLTVLEFLGDGNVLATLRQFVQNSPTQNSTVQRRDDDDDEDSGEE